MHEEPTPSYAEVVRRRRDALRELCAPILSGQPDFVWEIGCGHGHFLAAFAAAHPEKLCLGIDLVAERIERATRKRDRSRLANLHFIRADAGDFLAALPDPASFSAIYILFPDPWPKRRHHKNRLLTPGFLAQAAARAGEGARLYLRTDYAPYFEQARAAVAAAPAWRIAGEGWPFEAPTVFQSRAPSYQSLVAVRTGARGSESA